MDVAVWDWRRDGYLSKVAFEIFNSQETIETDAKMDGQVNVKIMLPKLFVEVDNRLALNEGVWSRDISIRY